MDNRKRATRKKTPSSAVRANKESASPAAKGDVSLNTELWKGRGKKHAKGTVSWQIARELDPECSYFPPSAWSSSLKQARREDFLCTVRLGYDQAVTADSSGVYAGVFSDTPVGAQNWTNYAAVFDQYRVLAYRVKFEPFWTVNITFAPMASVIDRSDSTALTSYGLAERYGSHKKAMGKASWSQLVTMASVDTADFLPTTSVTASAWIKTYSSGNTASITLGRMNVELLVQFRGVGIN